MRPVKNIIRLADEFSRDEIEAIRAKSAYQTPQELGAVFGTNARVIASICKSGRTKFTFVNHDDVLADYDAGMRTKDVGTKYGINSTRVSKIIALRRGITDNRTRAIRSWVRRSKIFQENRLKSGESSFVSYNNLLLATVNGIEFVLDIEQETLFRSYPWRAHPSGRLVRQKRSPCGRVINIAIYHDILGVEPSRSVVVDHINRDPRDNRRDNLRVISSSGNSLNRGVPIDVTAPLHCKFGV